VTAAKDPYDVLGVPVGADEQTIRRAFRRLARESHPDSSPAGDAERFQDLVEAYERLLPRGRPRREARGDVSEIVSFYAWLAGRQPGAEATEPEPGPEVENEPQPRRRLADRAAQVAALFGFGYAVGLLALLLSR
jgi:hypothetical protein